MRSSLVTFIHDCNEEEYSILHRAGVAFAGSKSTPIAYDFRVVSLCTERPNRGHMNLGYILAIRQCGGRTVNCMEGIVSPRRASESQFPIIPFEQSRPAADATRAATERWLLVG